MIPRIGPPDKGDDRASRKFTFGPLGPRSGGGVVFANQYEHFPGTLSQTSPSVLVIGHNPAMQDLALELVPKGRKSDDVRKKFPTAALAVLDVPIDQWRLLKPEDPSIVDFVTPKRLR
jgi:phosphohistidine phosphatase